MILDDTFSKEPLAPGVRDGDSQWAQVVEWAVFATIQAEEFGITEDNVDEQLRSTTRRPGVPRGGGRRRRARPGSGPRARLRVPGDHQVGNYGEIYDGTSPRSASSGAERAVDRGRAALRPAVPLTASTATQCR